MRPTAITRTDVSRSSRRLYANRPGAGSRPEVERLVACEQPLGLAAEDPGQLLLRQARLEAESHRHRRRHERREVREVAPEQELARRDECEEGGEVVRMPPRRVDEEVRMIRHDSPDPAQVADRRVGEDDSRLGKAAGKRNRVACEGRDPTPGVHEHGQPPLVREGEQRLDLRVRELEALRPRVELDPPRTGVDAAARLGHRVLLRVDPAEGVEATVGGLGLAEDAVVCGWVPVRLVHRHDHAPSLGGGQRGDELVAGEREAVRVVEADVTMDVEEGRTGGELVHRVLVPGPDHLVVVELAQRRALHELEGRRSETDPVAGGERLPLDRDSVDHGPVAGAEVLDDETAVVAPADRRVAPGELRVVGEPLEPGSGAPDQKLVADLKSEPCRPGR